MLAGNPSKRKISSGLGDFENWRERIWGYEGTLPIALEKGL